MRTKDQGIMMDARRRQSRIEGGGWMCGTWGKFLYGGASPAEKLVDATEGDVSVVHTLRNKQQLRGSRGDLSTTKGTYGCRDSRIDITSKGSRGGPEKQGHKIRLPCGCEPYP